VDTPDDENRILSSLPASLQTLRFDASWEPMEVLKDEFVKIRRTRSELPRIELALKGSEYDDVDDWEDIVKGAGQRGMLLDIRGEDDEQGA
jgi:hypothetical protein